MSVEPIELLGVTNEDPYNYNSIAQDYENNNKNYNSDFFNFINEYPERNNNSNDINSLNWSPFNTNNDKTSIIHRNVRELMLGSLLTEEDKSNSSFDFDNLLLHNFDRTMFTNYQTIQPITYLSSKKLIFDIKKPKKLGKRIKSETCKFDDPLVHNKYDEDLLIIKIKRYSSHNYLNHLNLMLKNSQNSQINKIQLKKIDPSIIIVNSKTDNIKLLKKKMSEIFSGKLSKRFKNIDSFYNKKSIDLIMKKGDEEIINALKKTFKDSLDIYCSKSTDIYLFEKFQKIEDDAEKFRENGEDEDYIKAYIRVAKNFEVIIDSKNEREPRRKVQK